MKIIRYSVFRALCAIAVGALLVKYREDMVEWMTIAIGVLFFLSGLTAMIASMAKKKVVADDDEVVPVPVNVNVEQEPTERAGWGWGSFVGLGCMILGLVLASNVRPLLGVHHLGSPHHWCHTAVRHPRHSQARCQRGLLLLDYAHPTAHSGRHSTVQTHHLRLCTAVLHRMVPHHLWHSGMHQCPQGSQQSQQGRKRS